VLVWDPADPGAGPVELGRHSVRALLVLAVLPDGRVASGGEDGVLVWDMQNGTARSFIACSAYAFATSPSPSGAYLFIGHASGGISCWEVHAAAQNMPGTRQRAGQTRCNNSEPFSSCFGFADLQNVDCLGELTGAPGAAAELIEDLPGLRTPDIESYFMQCQGGV
jgi:hypothetical protein